MFFILPKLDSKMIKKDSLFLNVGVKDIFFIPQLSITNNNFSNYFGFGLSLLFDNKNFFLLLSSLQFKQK